jgi:hypothetical protein
MDALYNFAEITSYVFFINLIRVEESHKGGSSSRLLSSLNAGEENIFLTSYI